MTNGLFGSEIGGGNGDNALAGTQDGNLIAPSEDFIDEVTDEKNGHALLLQLRYDLEKAVHFATRNGRRRPGKTGSGRSAGW